MAEGVPMMPMKRVAAVRQTPGRLRYDAPMQPLGVAGARTVRSANRRFTRGHIMRTPRLPCLLALLVALAGCDKLTAENYAKVRVGMAYQEVTAILGPPASCDDTLGFKSCRWGDDERNATVRFVGEKVVLHTAENIR